MTISATVITFSRQCPIDTKIEATIRLLRNPRHAHTLALTKKLAKHTRMSQSATYPKKHYLIHFEIFTEKFVFIHRILEIESKTIPETLFIFISQ
ncbi:hypothetical protein GCM10007860_25800 [Chitiniphilus shinanonensis]|uniref:Uncharacterized protein n=1 Tax=Chitiniphilus shinanonensis TaxID=553088 RepID=A0ABQ6BVD8_9NEIS|nr:hypothetical protein GCM10007860_25800 [Chitiniphilus shinanonensis]